MDGSLVPPRRSESTFGDDEFEGTASFAIGDYDKLKRPEFSTGYVPTILLVQDGKCAPSRFDLRAWSSDRRLETSLPRCAQGCRQICRQRLHEDPEVYQLKRGYAKKSAVQHMLPRSGAFMKRFFSNPFGPEEFFWGSCSEDALR